MKQEKKEDEEKIEKLKANLQKAEENIQILAPIQTGPNMNTSLQNINSGRNSACFKETKLEGPKMVEEKKVDENKKRKTP